MWHGWWWCASSASRVSCEDGMSAWFLAFRCRLLLPVSIGGTSKLLPLSCATGIGLQPQVETEGSNPLHA